MPNNRAARLQFAIHELIDILAEEITARVVASIPEPSQAGPIQTPPIDRHPCLLRRAEVEKRTGLSKTTIYDRISAGTFPAQIKLGGTVAWLESDIEAWMEGLSRKG
ncbi:AlpA family phage regulatory protein [Stenotrophomonas maltophilia]|nr:AlpA family phage regulatory protein [Stenotrophomonas maltophilia]